MSLRTKTLVLVLSLGVAALAAAAIPWVAAGPAPLPTYTVQRQDFERRVVADGHLSAVKATPLAPDPTIRAPLRIAWMVPDGSRVSAGDPVVRFDATEMESRLEDARLELTKTELKMGKEGVQSESEIANLRRDEKLAALELESSEQFQKKDELIYSRQEIIEAEIDRALTVHKREHAEQLREAREEMSVAELEILRIEKRRAREKIEEAEHQLTSLEIVAPHDGLVVFERDWRGNLPRVGDQVFGGNTLAEIPDLSEMQAEVYVLEADAGGLEVGKPAQIRLEAHPEKIFAAVVERVDALAKPRLRESPVQYFSVTLDLEQTDSERMKPGQRVRATLLLERREDVLVVPRQAVFEREGRKVVFRKDGDEFEPVEVTLGAIGLGRVVVESGLSEGDVVTLADPGRSLDGGAEEESAEPRVSPGFGGLGAP